jgi:hypothetical protein
MEAYGVEVGQPVERHGPTGVKLGDHSECRDCSKLVVSFINPLVPVNIKLRVPSLTDLKVRLCCADSEVVEDNVALDSA